MFILFTLLHTVTVHLCTPLTSSRIHFLLTLQALSGQLIQRYQHTDVADPVFSDSYSSYRISLELVNGSAHIAQQRTESLFFYNIDPIELILNHIIMTVSIEIKT